MRKLTLVLALSIFFIQSAFAGAYFGAANSVVNCGTGASITNLSTMTVSFWIKAVSAGGSSLGRLVCKDSAGAGQWVIRYDGDASTLLFAKDFDGATDLSVDTSGLGSLVGAWTNIIVTWDGTGNVSGVNFYKNAKVQSKSVGTAGAGNAVSDSLLNLFIGNTVSGGRNADSIISDVAIWNKILSSNEIDLLAKTRVKGIPMQISRSNLVAYLPLDDYNDNETASSGTFKDRNTFRNNGTPSNGPIGKAEGVLSYP